MATVTAGMTVSSDGFVADSQGSASRLYPDLADLQRTDYMNAAIEQTGAVVMGRRTFEMGDPDSYVGNYEYQLPGGDTLATGAVCTRAVARRRRSR
jgi:dihydrofolate reductase